MPSKKNKKHPLINKQTKEKYSVCKTCVFTYKHKKIILDEDAKLHPQSEKKQKLVDLLGGRCEICGYDKSIAALSFHHKDRKKKKFAISTYLNLPLEDLVIEAKKCSLICLNCHAELHNGKKSSAENSG
jgi:hypothetical protein